MSPIAVSELEYDPFVASNGFAELTYDSSNYQITVKKNPTNWPDPGTLTLNLEAKAETLDLAF